MGIPVDEIFLSYEALNAGKIDRFRNSFPPDIMRWPVFGISVLLQTGRGKKIIVEVLDE
jgi:hypothetical protein